MKTKTPSRPTKTAVAPCVATSNEICRLARDNTNSGNFSLSTDGYRVYVGDQAMGEAPKQGIEMPRKTFNRLLRWYLKPSKFVRQ